jgi:hypothetical protein
MVLADDKLQDRLIALPARIENMTPARCGLAAREAAGTEA